MLAFIAVRIALATLRWAPLPLAEVLSRGYVRLLDSVVPKLRRTAYRNLQMALPGADHRRVTDGAFRSIARLLVTFARFPDMNAGNIRRWIRYDGLEHFTEAKRRGHGVLFATAHLGNWELSAFAHALMSEPMHVVVRPLDNRLVDTLIERWRALSGNQIIDKKDAARSVLRALAANQAVGILIDQNAALDEGVFVPFFGVDACVGTAFARIAHRSRAVVIPGYAIWSDSEGRYILRFEPPVEISGDEVEDTRRVHARLEAAIRDNPEQWLWMHRRWKTRPGGRPSLY